MRTRNNGELRISNVGEKVTLAGWVAKKRNFGNLVFIDLRDRTGIVQLVVRDGSVYETASSLKNESVLKVVGKVCERESKNMNIPTGEIEIEVEEMEVLSTSKDIPFEISDDTTALEDTRLKYRYLDLRNDKIHRNILLRSEVMKFLRTKMDKLGFAEGLFIKEKNCFFVSQMTTGTIYEYSYPDFKLKRSISTEGNWSKFIAYNHDKNFLSVSICIYFSFVFYI